MLEIRLVPCLRDNYAYLLHEPGERRDRRRRPVRGGAGDGGAEGEPAGASPTSSTPIIIRDHTGGNLALKAATGASVVGPRPDRERIPGIDIAVDEGDAFRARRRDRASALHPRPHARPHRLLVRGQPGALLRRHAVPLGCGRLFEGTPPQMWTVARQAARACPTTRASIAATNTPRPTPASRSPSIPTTPALASAQPPGRRMRAPRASHHPSAPGRGARDQPLPARRRKPVAARGRPRRRRSGRRASPKCAGARTFSEMAKLRLYSSPSSPFVRKVRVAAIESGLMDRIERRRRRPAPAGSPCQHQSVAPHPGAGARRRQALFESGLICEYLDCLHEGPKLFPPTGPARWRALRLQALGDGVMTYAVSRINEPRRPEGERSPT